MSTRSEPFCDFLSCTCSPSESFVDELSLFMGVHCFDVVRRDSISVVYRVGSGTVKVQRRSLFHSVGVSGGALSHLKARGLFLDLIDTIGSVGYKVTRLDVAVDVLADTPPILRDLEARYPDDRFNFGRKSLKVTRFYSARPSDLQLTGTWYAGRKSNARVTVRVYDKAQESLEKRCEVIPPTTRYELTFSRDYGCSLFDAIYPHCIFYSHSHGTLLSFDGYVEPWESRGCIPWTSEPRDTDLTLERFERRLRRSPDFVEIVKLAALFGAEGKWVIMRRFERQLDDMIRQAELERGDGGEVRHLDNVPPKSANS